MALNPLNRKLDKNGNPIITKEELDKSGMSLRDFLNKERGLERKREKTVYPQVEPKVRNKVTPDQVSRVARGVGVMEPENIPGPVRRTSDENMDATSETFKRGGKVGSASKRADGIAKRGKTRGKMC